MKAIIIPALCILYGSLLLIIVLRKKTLIYDDDKTSRRRIAMCLQYY